MALFTSGELSDMMGGVRDLLQQSPALQTLAQSQAQGMPGLGDFVQNRPAFDPMAAFGDMWGNQVGGGNVAPLQQSFTNLNSALFQGFDILTKDKQQKDANQAAQDAAHNPIRWIQDRFGNWVQTTTPGGNTTGPNTSGGGGASTGLASGVAKWADQTKSTFGDIQGLDPDTMLAIMTNESGGDPNAYNAAGNARGLFQNVGLQSNDPNDQFAAAHQLAQEKMASIAQSYAANGLNPDARTRARDFALAWAGHFDYSTGQPNPNSRDVGSGQTADQLSSVFLDNYDKIKNGRQQQAPSASGGGAGLAGITPGVNGSIMQEFGPTDYAQSHQSTYHYGTAYGLGEGNHPGVDWAVPMGSKVTTPLGGVVSVVGNDHGSGYYYQNTMSGSDPDHSGEYQVTLDNGDMLILGHLSQINAQVGQRVSAGQLIGLSGGSDGEHVHVEYRQRQADGSYRIVDPRPFLGAGQGGGGGGQGLTP